MLAQEHSHHHDHGILIKSVQSAASANMTKNGKQIATVKWTPAAPGALRQVPPTKILRKAYENPTNGKGVRLGVFGGSR